VYSQEHESLAIRHATVIQPDRVLHDAAVGVENGCITEVREDGRLAHEYVEYIDAGGAYLMPGIIDVHNDGLEVEINPRPETNLPVEMAMATMERRLLASGVTTEFHAIAFMENERNKRTVANAAQRARYVCEYIESGRQMISNQILHRLDVWSPDSLDMLFESATRSPLKYISINDHTPGQGQYRDLSSFRERMTAWAERRGGPGWTQTEVERRMSVRAADTDTVPAAYARIQAEAARMPLMIASHDDDSAAKVDVLCEIGARVTEFPVAIDAAERARQHGMTIVVGAPNVVRGGSSSGNLDASELFRLGLADVICADYHAPSMLPAAFRLVDEGIVDLPAAIRALTFNAANALLLTDLGAVRTGYIADLLLVRRDPGGIPLVERVFRGGREVLSLRAPAGVEVPA
jgi:alpha-D-ribose 1-methylphosphonate 5-triphosphate diphosphatase